MCVVLSPWMLNGVGFLIAFVRGKCPRINGLLVR